MTCWRTLGPDRLRLGSIRWKSVGTDDSRNAGKQTCLIHVPVNKTSTAFVKPVDSIVGREIEAWEKVRPEQPAMLDDKPVNSFTSFLSIGPAGFRIDI
jgi:hypothetical protein